MKKFLCLLGLLLAALPSLGAVATPVSVSSVAVSGNTLTVTTSAAHGLSATLPSGFCMTGSSVSADNVCGVVLTIPTGTTFTFTLVGGVVCSASCGSVAPAKRAIWLQTATVSGGYQVTYLLWLTTTSPVAGAAKTSAWPNASAVEVNAVVAGLLIEVQRTQFFPLGTSLANAEAFIVNDWTTQQNALAASVQPGTFYGNFFDGVGWLQ
jgi:hypothetical protein